MCGIAGLLAAGIPGPDVEQKLVQMLQPMRMRGPDGQGTQVALHGRWTIGLGHRRLAILDLSEAAAQPMRRGKLSIVFNGEIYNYLELRRELETFGHRFVTRSDTEVLLAAYQQWGEACLERLNGMFALAIWDANEAKLFCARDRAGERPFYYYRDSGHFVFASEIQALLAVGPPVPRAANWRRVHEYLAKGFQPLGETTYFEGILELLPGHALRLSLEEDSPCPTITRYWAFPDRASGGPPLAAEELAALLDDAVRIRLRSDVPVGTCLSGGLDSPSVAACVVRAASRSESSAFRYQGIHAYAPVPEADERAYVHRLARQLGIAVDFVEVTGSGLHAELDDLIVRQEFPFLDPSIYAQRCVFRRATELGLKVMLDGQGADELLGGYDWAVPRVIAACATQRGWLAAARQLQKFSGPRFPLPRLLVQTLARCLPDGKREFPNDVGKALVASFTHLGLPTLLRQGDRNALTFGVEVRLPFLDHRLIEATARLRLEDVACDGYTKVLLRRAMKDRLPEELLARTDKFAFAVPQARWMQHELKGAVQEAAADRFWRELDWPGTRRLLRQALAETRGAPYRRAAWKVLCLSRWQRLFFG